jgi:phosphoglycolate phosphatase-like HAD superfamily hydrolase
MSGNPAAGRYRLIVFDFDGTLCDSADVKTDAFHQLYLDEHGPDFAARVLAYHLDNAGISRYDKIRYVESDFLGAPPSEERVEEVAARFSSLVEDAVVAAPLFTGVLDFLASTRGIAPTAIASATPTSELRRIVERKGIAPLFDSVEGSPRSKSEILTGFAAQFDVPVNEIVMVGDQPSDARGAREAGTGAVLISPAADWAAPYPCVATFSDAARWLNDRIAPAPR